MKKLTILLVLVFNFINDRPRPRTPCDETANLKGKMASNRDITGI